MEEYDIAIIGCGPAGLSAAVFCGRTDLKTVLIGIPEKSHLYSAPKVENYFGFPDGVDGSMLLNKGVLHASRFGVKLLKDEAVTVAVSEENGRVFFIKTNKDTEIKARSLIIATGATTLTTKIENEEKFAGKGVHYCIWCDAPLYKNKKFIIIGNGGHAADEALEALIYTNDITVVSNADKFEFSESFQNELKKYKIKTICTKVKSFNGNEKLESLVLDDYTEMKTDVAFMASGAAGFKDFAENMGLEVKDNAIVVDENCMTNMDGVFAAGNCEGRCKQVAKNVGDGCNAAISAIRYLRYPNNYTDYGENKKEIDETEKDDKNETRQENNENIAEVKEETKENIAETTDDCGEIKSDTDNDSIKESLYGNESNVERQIFSDESKSSYQLKNTDDEPKNEPNKNEAADTNDEKRKLRIGWFSFSCCEDSTIVFTEMLNDYWDTWKNIVDIRYCRPLKKNNDMTDLDIAFVEGAISNEKAANELRSIRLNCKKLIAIGACAITGMPSGQRNDFDERRKREIDPIVKAFDYRKSVAAVHEIVKVDDSVPGCPMIEATFLNVLNKYVKEFGFDA